MPDIEPLCVYGGAIAESDSVRVALKRKLAGLQESSESIIWSFAISNRMVPGGRANRFM